jgi:hypothetical protein
MDTVETRLGKRRGGLNGLHENKVRAGQIGGTNASPEGILGKVRSGKASNALMPPEVRSLGGRVGCHMRWHVKRGIIRNECEFCLTPPEPPKAKKARKKAAKAVERYNLLAAADPVGAFIDAEKAKSTNMD